MFAGNFAFDLFVGNDAAFLRVDEEHAARLEAAFLEDALGRDIEHADSLAMMTMSSLVT
jgi:hypothetical protein